MPSTPTLTPETPTMTLTLTPTATSTPTQTLTPTPETPTQTITFTPTFISSACLNQEIGSPYLNPAQHKWGFSSLQVDGSSLLEITDSPELNFGAGEFSIELWIKKVAHNACHLITQGTSEDPSDLAFSIRLDAEGSVIAAVGIFGAIHWLDSGAVRISDTLSWHHISLNRSSGHDLILTVDGAVVDHLSYLSQIDEVNNSTSLLQIGALHYEDIAYTSEGFVGYIDDVRISNVSRYSLTNLDVPSGPFNCDFNTILLLNMEINLTGMQNSCGPCLPFTPTPYPLPPTVTCTTLPRTELDQNVVASQNVSEVVVSYPIPVEFKVGATIIFNENGANEEEGVISHIDLETSTFYLSSALNNDHSMGEYITTGCCSIYRGFEFGLSFPDNVRKAVDSASLDMGPTGPSGPVGPAGPAGGVNDEAETIDILTGNGQLTYVSPAGWFAAANMYSPLIWTESIENQQFIPNAQNHTIFDVTYNGPCPLAAPINFENGRTITIVLRRGDSGGIVNVANEYKFDGGYEMLSTVVGAIDVIVATNINGLYFCTIANDIKRL